MCPCFRVPVSATSNFLIHHFFFMKKLSSLLLLALFLFTGLSMKAQVLVSQGVYYKPGARIDMSTVTAGQKVFIYSTFNDGTNNYSRFIVNSNNSATVAAADVTPANFVTNGVSNIWEVQSVADETSNGVTAKKITLVRNMGVTANKYLGIGGASSNGSVGDAQTFYVTSWSDDVYKSGTTKVSGTKFYVDATGESGESWSDTQTDNVYMVTAGTSKCFRTSGGSYNTSSTEAYPIIFYTVESATTPEGARDLKISDAPSGGQWAANTTWYKIKIDGTSNRYWSVDKNYTDVNGYLKLSNTTEPTNLAGLWCVVGDVVNGYKFYNAAKGTNYVLSTTGSGGGASTKMVATSSVGSLVTNFDICTTQYSSATTTSWAVKDKDSDYNYLNYREPYLAHWNSDGAFHSSNGKGSMIDFIEVSAEDVASYVDAEKTSVLSRFEAWTHIPALWPTASDVYNTLNTAVTAESATDATKLAAIQTAGEAFVAALNGVRFTAQNRGNGDRSSRFLSIGSSSCVGVIPDYSMDEVLTIKPNTDGSFKIYGENSGKYISSSASAVDLASAEDFYLQTSASDVTAVENVAGFHLTSHATNLLHLNNFQNEGTTENPMIVYGFGDAASRWLLSTDLSRYELQTAINNATTWKTNLETLIDAQKSNLSQSPYVTISTLASAIATAQSAFDATSGTQATRTAAIAPLNAALTKAQGTWLGDLGSAQQFRLKSNTITDYYLTANQDVAFAGEGVLRLFTAPAADAENYETVLANQTFTLVPGTGADAGKYILQSNGKKITNGNVYGWNASMSDAGSPYAFEFTDLANALVRVKTANGYVGPNSSVTTANVETVYNNAQDASDPKNGFKTNSFVYINHGSNNGNIVWTLEFVAPIGSVDDAKAALQTEYNRVHAWYTTNWKNLIKKDGPTMKAYTDACTSAEQIIATSSGLTVYDVNTAKVTLTETYKMMLQNLLTEADPRQFFALRNAYEKPVDNGGPGFPLYMEIVSKNTAEGIKLQAKATTAETQKAQSFKFTVNSDGTFVIGTGEGQRIVKTSGSGWDTQTADEGGHGFIIESVESVEGGFRILTNANQGFGPNMQTWQGSTAGCNVVGAPIYYNQAPITNENLVWVLETVVSSELMEDMKSSMDRLSSYNTNTHIGTGLGQYSYTGSYTKDFADAAIASANDIYTSSGAYEETPADNAAILYMLNTLNAAYESLVINQPTPGKLYRFKGKKSGKYMASASSSTRNKMVLNEEAANGLETVFKLVEDGGNYKLLNCGNGYFITNTHDASALKANANTITFNASESSYIGYYTIKTNYSSPYIYDDKTDNEVDRNGSYAADHCDWQIEEVTWLPVPINTTVGFGTLYSPVPLKGVSSGNYNQDGRLEFYYGVKVNEAGVNKLKLTKLEGDIPAETGLIVKYKDGIQSTGCVYMEIADTDPEFTADNALTGTLETVAKPATGTVYTMQKPADSPLGFYNFTGANVKGGKAYLHVVDSEAAPMGLVFDFGGETTGVESIEVNTDNQVIYDLSGRRVAKAGKGLYIINGKKVLVK